MLRKPDGRERGLGNEKGTGHSNKPGAPDKNGPFVPWTVSLPGQHWDVLTLQVWQDDDKATLKRDTEAVNDIIKITRTRPDNATTRFFIYAPWTVSKIPSSPPIRSRRAASVRPALRGPARPMAPWLRIFPPAPAIARSSSAKHHSRKARR